MREMLSNDPNLDPNLPIPEEPFVVEHGSRLQEANLAGDVEAGKMLKRKDVTKEETDRERRMAMSNKIDIPDTGEDLPEDSMPEKDTLKQVVEEEGEIQKLRRKAETYIAENQANIAELDDKGLENFVAHYFRLSNEEKAKGKDKKATYYEAVMNLGKREIQKRAIKN